ncbi:MAG: hypothetical protein A3E36_04685 [Candidatus Andersenbacteria bacterium RIFCSPHIGHO2_12_FULL_45_11b]|uniref:Uncharacterized protein n=1 Tax=Candidatus Andersenbacteria bacterium RIFCSPHIGHO2_12_FULL_45_11b TaxID=1797282 RepID=A0A1G1XC34_9BACT|nr:MAG: hypothetical protein A3E36_04685 [Candidatus Andersenbacteria bacterium RIFCSPHIGHO2_12_FULL_45_11b]
MSNAIRGQALSPEQYFALQETGFQIPSMEELFDFQVEALKRMEIQLTIQEVSEFRKMVPTGPLRLFLVIPRQMTVKSFDWILGQIAKKIPGIDGAGNLNSSILEVLRSDAQYAGPHMLYFCDDDHSAVQQFPQRRMQYFATHQTTPYTLWQLLMHLVVYPPIAGTHQLMALGSVWEENGLIGKMSPVIQVAEGQLQIAMRTWKDTSSNCIYPSFRGHRAVVTSLQ